MIKILILEFHRMLKQNTRDFSAIVKLHGEFEKIHPFQDGNGRVVRFVMLKQCIENNICLIAIDEKYNHEYKRAICQG